MPTPAAPDWRRPSPAAQPPSSLGLSTRQGALLAYAAGWISGLILLTLEASNREIRRHAAQAFIGFGGLTLLGALLLMLAGASLLTSLTMARVCFWAASGIIGVGLVLWCWSMVQVARGGSPRWPLIGARAERLAGI